MKYKLIKQYPLSPGEGYIAEEDEFTFMKDYPEFWEEIPEPLFVQNEIEILEFKWKDTIFIKSPVVNLWYNVTSIHGENMNGIRKDSEITKVKRLSDGAIFKLGDLVNNPKLQRPMPFVITKFYFDCGNEHILCNGENCGNGHINVMKVEHYTAPKYLFTTEDGVSIYAGDFHFSVNKKTLALADNGVAQIGNSASHKDVWWTFSTKELAEQFISENKPIYSKKQVKEALNTYRQLSGKVYVIDVYKELGL